MLRLSTRDARIGGMADAERAGVDGGPSMGSTAMWYWIVVLIVLFMVGVIALAIIQTHAQ
jgi:hypothetical protein